MGICKSLKWIALASWGLSVGCDPGTEQDNGQGELKQSLRTWSELKASNEPQYRYASRNVGWTGDSSRTTVDVVNDAVVARAYTSFDAEGAEVMSWTEDTASLGSHPEGAAPLTIDQIYERCGSEILSKDAEKNWITLTFSEDGVLAHCSYFPRTCADDCDVGFSIDSLEFLTAF